MKNLGIRLRAIRNRSSPFSKQTEITITELGSKNSSANEFHCWMLQPWIEEDVIVILPQLLLSPGEMLSEDLFRRETEIAAFEIHIGTSAF